MTDPSLPALLLDLFWPSDPATRTAILLLIGLAVVLSALVQGPLIVRLARIGRLQRAVQACFHEESSNTVQRHEVANAFAESPLAYHWSDFVRRWQNAIAADPIQDASLPELSRAPVRLADVLAERPLIPPGARRNLLPALPAIFLSAGLLGAFAGLVLAMPGIALTLDPSSFDPASRSLQVSALMDQLGLTMRIGLWGLLLSLAAAITGRLVEGRAEVLGEALDSWVQLAYGAISTGELATRTAHEQRRSLARLQDELTELTRQVAGRPRPVIRSAGGPEGGGTAAAPLDADAIRRAVAELGEGLSRELQGRLDRLVSEELAVVRDAVDRVVEARVEDPDSLAEAVGMRLDERLGELGDALADLAARVERLGGTGTETRRPVSLAGLGRPPPEPASAQAPPPAASDVDTLPDLEAPAARRAADPSTPGRSLSGALLRATHHSGPSSDVSDPDFDAMTTVRLASLPKAADAPGEETRDAAEDESPSHDGDAEDGHAAPRSGFFARRK